MSGLGVLIDDMFKVKDVDPVYRASDRYRRFLCDSEKFGVELLLEINTIFYPLKLNDEFRMMIATSLRDDSLVVDAVADDGVADDGVADNGVADNGVADDGVADNGVADNGVADNGIADNGVADNGVADNGVVDNGVTDDGVVDNGVADNDVADDGVVEEDVVDEDADEEKPFDSRGPNSRAAYFENLICGTIRRIVVSNESSTDPGSTQLDVYITHGVTLEMRLRADAFVLQEFELNQQIYILLDRTIKD